MMGSASKSLAFVQMAVKTDTRLGRTPEYRLVRIVNVVARSAGQPGAGMAVGVPVVAITGLVAAETDGILRIYRCRAFVTKYQWLDLQWVGNMSSGRSMA
jgi:hypothetical protein